MDCCKTLKAILRLQKLYRFSCQKVRSGSGKLLRIQIGLGPKSSRCDKIRIHNTDLLSSVADPDPGWVKKSRSEFGSGIRILDEHPRLYFQLFGLKYLNSLMRIRIRDLESF
jgi:hypothetical protein